jgi:hypothetical protein
MTPEERQLITGLFDRMRGFALTGKDGEAEALIREQVGTLPDAPYMLVQSVLVQEQALQQADSRIKALEEQVRTLQNAQQRPGSGSFLGGGLFGSRATPEADREPGSGGSVPTVGSRATPSAYSGQSAWGPQYGGAQPPGAPTAPPPPEPGGGSFLRSAMATATGVAGGMLAASAISSLFGGHAHAGTPTATGATAPQQTQATVPDTTGGGAAESGHASGPQHQDQDQGYQEAAYDDDDGWFGGGSDDDFEI